MRLAICIVAIVLLAWIVSAGHLRTADAIAVGASSLVLTVCAAASIRKLNITQGTDYTMHGIGSPRAGSPSTAQSNLRTTRGGHDRRLTYVLDTDPKLMSTDFKLYMPDATWREVRASTKPKHVDFVMCLSGGSRSLYATRAKLKSRVDSLELTDKVAFHNHMMQIRPDLIAASVELGPDHTLPEGAVWMIRANWGWKGRASLVATTTEELRAIYAKFSQTPPNWRKPTRPRVLGSEYIQDPLLWKGFKFHVRAYVIVVIPGANSARTRYAVMLQLAEIIPAGKPYIAADWADQDIHDTHDARNVLNGILPRDMDGGDTLYAAMVETIRGVIVPMLPMLQLYPEAENAYDIFGIDVMFRADGSPVVIEVNSTPGLVTDTGDARMYMNDEMAVGVMHTAFNDFFGDPAAPRLPSLTYL